MLEDEGGMPEIVATPERSNLEQLRGAEAARGVALGDRLPVDPPDPNRLSA